MTVHFFQRQISVLDKKKTYTQSRKSGQTLGYNSLIPTYKIQMMRRKLQSRMVVEYEPV